MNDSIFFWNTIALEVVRISHTEPSKREQNGPVLAARALAIVHLAMYDAYAAIVGGPGFPRYLNPPPVLPVPPGTSARDAVAGAAQITLNVLYPAQTEFVNAQLAIFDFTNPSYVFGRHIGNAVLGLRSNDLDARDCGYRTSNNRGRHRVDPDNPGQGFHAPYYGAQTRGFAISTRHGLNPPPFANGLDPDYLLALRDVRAKGIRPDLLATLPAALFTNRRTPAETLTGIYWAYDGAVGLGIPERLYNQIVRKVAGEQGNNEGQNARLFAFVNAAMADAAALAWEQKYCHDFWRPVVGIREHDETLGPAAPHAVAADFNDGDPGWLPLGAPSTNSTGLKNFTPNFPAYPSGHATIGAAALHITRMFYGVAPNDKSNDTLFQGGGPFNVPAWFVSDEFNGGNRDNEGTVRPRHTRFFPGGLWQAIVENAQSRIFLGVHWIFDAFDFTQDPSGALVPDFTNENIGGVGLGLRIARDIFATGAGLAPRQTPNASAVPPILTPAPNSPMPALPTQPANVAGCANPQPALSAADASSEEAAATDSTGGRVKGSAKKAVAKVLGKKGREESPVGGGGARPEGAASAPTPWPSGISEQDEGQPSNTGGAWPSGISEK